MYIVAVILVLASVAHAQITPPLQRSVALVRPPARLTVPHSGAPLRSFQQPSVGDKLFLRPSRKVEPLRAKSGAIEFTNPVTLYKITDGRCSQSTIEDGFGAIVSKSVRGFKEGDCASVGYTKPDGAKATSMPVIGDIDVLYFTKPPPKKDPIKDFFAQFQGAENLVEDSNVHNAITASVVGLAGFVVGSCSVLVILHTRRGGSPTDFEPLMAA